MAIDIRALSITSLFNTVKAFFKSQENNSRWKDSTAGAEGNFLMRMLSNAISVLSQRVVVGRREQFHDTANLYSSNIGLAVNNGYSVFRGTNTKFIVNITPTMTRPYPAFSTIGHYDTSNGQMLIVTQDYTFVKDEPQTIELTVGKLKEIQFNANTNDLKKFVRFEQNISEDIQLLLDGLVAPHTNIKRDQALHDKYYIYTNPWKSVTMEYLNNKAGAAHKYSSDTVFTLKYIESDPDLLPKELTDEMFDYATINDITLIKNPVPFESITEIKLKSPIYREVQNLVRAKADFPDLITQNTPNVIKTGFKPLTPTFTAVTYMKDDFSRLVEVEEDAVIDAMDPALAFGRPRPDIEHPICETVTLDITLGMTNRYTDEADVAADVQSIIDANYANMFKMKFNRYDLEQLLNKLAYVKYSRVEFHTEERKAYTTYKIGDLIEEDGKVYKCTGIIGTTGNAEPIWNVPSMASTEILMKDADGKYYDTVDRNIVWRCYKRLNSLAGLQMWRAGKGYKIGDFVYTDGIPNYMFKCVDVYRSSGGEEPDTTMVEKGDTIIDGTMVLLCLGDSMSSYPYRQNSTPYAIGTKLNIGYNSFEYIGQVGKSSSTEKLEFNDNELALANIDWEANEGAGYINRADKGIVYIKDPTGKVSNSLNIGDIIRIRAKEAEYVPCTDLPDEDLIATTVLKTKVKEYSDEATSSGSSEDSTGVNNIITTTIEYNVSFGYRTSNDLQPSYSNEAAPGSDVDSLGYKPNTELYTLFLKTLEVGDVFTDGDLELQVIEDNTYLPVRIPHYGYASNEEFQIICPDINDGTTFSRSISCRVMPYETSSASSSDADGTNQGSSGSGSSDEPVDPNANWKQLERMLKLQEEIQEWIDSEKYDRLKTPNDVIVFFGDTGRLTKTGEGEGSVAFARKFYNQYSAEDEYQIYLCMDQYGKTRLEAIDILNHPDGTQSDNAYNKGMKLLGKPVSTANDVKYYLKSDPDTLMYVDRVKPVISSSSKYMGCNVYRYDEKGPDSTVEVYGYIDIDSQSDQELTNRPNRIKTTIYGATGAEIDEEVEGIVLGDSDLKVTASTSYATASKVVKEHVYVTSIKDINSNRALILDGRLSKYTQIFTDCNIGFYEPGSYINPSLRRTDDGDLIWELVDNLDEMEFDWNVYNQYVPNLTIKY